MGKVTVAGIQAMTWIPSYIIEEILRDAPGGEFKLLIALYHVAQKTGGVTTQILAQICGISEVDVISACEYWNSRGILNILTMDSSGNLELEFFPSDAHVDETGQKEQSAASDDSLLMDNPFRELVSALEMVMGKPMSASLLRFTMELKDEYQFDDQVIMLLFSSCAGKETKSYMEKVAMSWKKQYVRSAEDANALIRRFEEKWHSYRELFRYMGMDPSSIAQPQEEQLDRWFEDYGFDLALLKHAAQRCISQLGKADLNYIEGILKRWKSEGITTVADALKKDKLSKGGKKNPRQQDITSFNNYDQRSYDYDSLEKRLLGWRDEDE